MTELLIKMDVISILNAILLSELMSLKCSEISMHNFFLRTEAYSEYAWYIIENISKNQKQLFL